MVEPTPLKNISQIVNSPQKRVRLSAPSLLPSTRTTCETTLRMWPKKRIEFGVRGQTGQDYTQKLMAQEESDWDLFRESIARCLRALILHKNQAPLITPAGSVFPRLFALDARVPGTNTPWFSISGLHAWLTTFRMREAYVDGIAWVFGKRMPEYQAWYASSINADWCLSSRDHLRLARKSTTECHCSLLIFA